GTGAGPGGGGRTGSGAGGDRHDRGGRLLDRRDRGPSPLHRARSAACFRLALGRGGRAHGRARAAATSPRQPAVTSLGRRVETAGTPNRNVSARPRTWSSKLRRQRTGQ